MAATSLPLKKSYRKTQSLEQFYTGGPISVSSDGSFIACTCNDTIKIVDSSNASVKATLDGDSEPVTAIALTPNNSFLFSATHSRLIQVWDLATFQRVRSWKGHDGPVLAMASDASGGLLATAGADRKVLVWDVDGGFCTHYFKGHKGIVTSIMFHPDPNHLILFSGSDDGTVRAWDLVTKKCVATMEKHFSAVVSLAVSEDCKFLLSAGRDKVVNAWDLGSYACKTTVPTYEVLSTVCAVHPGTPFYDYLSLDTPGKSKSTHGVYFLTAGERGIIRIWNSEGAVCLFEQKTSDIAFSSDEDDQRRGFTVVCMLPSDQGLLCITADQQLLFYSPTKHSGEVLDLVLSKRLIGYNEEIVDMKFVGGDEKFLAVATNLEQVQVYDVASMSCSYVLAGHTGIILCLDTCTGSSGVAYIVTGSKDNSVRLWDTETKVCLGVGVGHLGAVGAVAFSKKQRNFFVSGSSDHTLKVWGFEGLVGDPGKPNSLKVKGAVGAHNKDINSVAIAPDDSLVCSGSQDRTARLFKLPELVEVATLVGHKRGIWFVEFSPVDPCVLTASGDKTIKLWSVRDHSCLKTFEGHTSSVLRASFITRGAQLVSTGADGVLKLWSVKSSECIATYDEHEDKVWALAIGRKTEILATGGSDAVINLWNDSTAVEKEEAFRKEEEGVLRGQDLENAVSDADYAKAILLAFELKKPHKLFELLSELYRKNIAIDHIRKALKPLGQEELRQLLEYVREWNTKPKLCHVANSVLLQTFCLHPPTDIDEVKGIGELLEGLIPYSQRHYNRIERVERSLYLLDYTLNGMSVIEPEDDSIVNNSEKIASIDQENRDTDSIAETATETKPSKSSKKRKYQKNASNDQENTNTHSVAEIATEITASKRSRKRKSQKNASNDQENTNSEPISQTVSESKPSKISKKQKSQKTPNASSKIFQTLPSDTSTISLQVCRLI